VADAHKLGDYSPHVFVSHDRGGRWQSIAGDLPDGIVAWAIQQDHVNPDLLFLGAENGVYFSLDGGSHWHRFAGAPTIAFRDIKLQRRDDDLVGASFGRGLYILDDYRSLRTMARAGFGAEPALFPVRDAWWYVPSVPSQARGMPAMGSDSYRTPNPDFGAIFSYYLPEPLATLKEGRRDGEKALREQNADVPFPGWDALEKEALEAQPRVLLLVSDADKEPVRWLEAVNEAGLHRTAWDLRRPAPDAVDLEEPGFIPPWRATPEGPLAAPGKYTVQLYAFSDGTASPLAAAQSFTVKPALAADKDVDYAAVAGYQQEILRLRRAVAAAGRELERASELLARMQAAALRAPLATPDLFLRLDDFGVEIERLKARLEGDSVRSELDEATIPSIGARANRAASWNMTRPATETQRRSGEIAQRELAVLESDLAVLLADPLTALEKALAAAEAPSWR
jgi:hypothetical protein